ncbi:uncharacterized protein V1516DRAFT_676525 [Lipomyces oligophaga]|uniref:uncharacterized protein n=1 Tax=Lipomyces oligophaga TaxID=45792 RepID=UPI0034CE68B1
MTEVASRPQASESVSSQLSSTTSTRQNRRSRRRGKNSREQAGTGDASTASSSAQPRKWRNQEGNKGGKKDHTSKSTLTSSIEHTESNSADSGFTSAEDISSVREHNSFSNPLERPETQLSNRHRHRHLNQTQDTNDPVLQGSVMNPNAPVFVAGSFDFAVLRATRTPTRPQGRSLSSRDRSEGYQPRLNPGGSRRKFGTHLSNLPTADFNDDQNTASAPVSSVPLDINDYFAGTDMSSNTLVKDILQEIHSGDYECMICINSVNRKSRIWSCSTCSRVFHISCIQKWAKKAQSIANDSNADPGPWRCPGCQTSRMEVPKNYTCWCGKAQNPTQSPLFPPHSCGQTCLHEYDDCPHSCQLLCHPGPHPKCSGMGPIMDCFCGKTSIQRSCASTNYEGYSCGIVCGELMACGVHTCSRPCHSGLCGPCIAPVHSSCYCGKEDKDVQCSHTLPERKSYYIDDEGDKSFWVGIWKCNNVCGRAFDCGKHFCEQECHSQDLEFTHCSMSPDVVLTCPCGKHSIEEILGHQRNDCTDPIPTCTDVCLKTLPCGHVCKRLCHSGPCGSCLEKVTVPCVCGHNKITLECFRTELEPVKCRRVCHVQLNCLRHECGALCCPGEKMGQKRLSKVRRRDASQLLNLDDIIEPQHICFAICNNLLKCGNHHCQITCHRGPCPPCLQASFDELTCHCGRTKMMPPIACGTKPPDCLFQCNRGTTCGHPPVSHNCHQDDVSCPKCPYFVERYCMCGKSLMKNQPCSRINVSCGAVCNKILPCGSHRCKKTCHSEGECDTECRQPCGKQKGCGHPDEELCHAPYECSEVQPCKAVIVIHCRCGNLTANVKCNATKTFKPPIRILKCNDRCAVIARNAKLAEALDIDIENRTGPASNVEVYPEMVMRLYATNKKWCESIEKVMENFVNSSTPKRSMSFPPMRSQQREFLHCMAESYGMDSISQDPEPHRSVVMHRTPRTDMPIKNLSQAFLGFVRKQQSSTSSSVMATSSSAWQVGKSIAKPYNAIYLEGIQIGVTRPDLERKIEATIKTSGISTLKFNAHWIADEDVILTPLNAEELKLSMTELDKELTFLRPLLKRYITTEAHIAQFAELCWLAPDNTVSYKESTKSTSSSASTSTNISPSTSLTQLSRSKPKYGSYNIYAALGAVSVNPGIERRSPKKWEKADKEPVAESWEDLDEDAADSPELEEEEEKDETDIGVGL